MLIMISCSKEEVSPGHGTPCGTRQPTAHITSIDLQNCKYIAPSKWVFIDSLNFKIDSITIESIHQGFSVSYCGDSFESHTMRTFQAQAERAINYVLWPWGIYKDPYGVNQGTCIYTDYETSSVGSQIDSIFIYDQFYKKVVRIVIDNDPTENNNKSVYFMNSEFGFLRHDIYSNDSLISNKVLLRKIVLR